MKIPEVNITYRSTLHEDVIVLNEESPFHMHPGVVLGEDKVDGIDVAIVMMLTGSVKSFLFTELGKII